MSKRRMTRPEAKDFLDSYWIATPAAVNTYAKIPRETREFLEDLIEKRELSGWELLSDNYDTSLVRREGALGMAELLNNLWTKGWIRKID